MPTVSTVKKSHASMLWAWLPEELPPAQSGALASGAKACVAQELTHGRGRDAYAQAGELTCDPLVAPARVLARYAQDKRSDFPADPRTTRALPRICPAPGHQPPVPTQKGFGRDEERTPAPAREEPARGGQEGSIGGSKGGAAKLPTKDRELMAKHHDLEFLEVPGPEAERDKLKQASQNM